MDFSPCICRDWKQVAYPFNAGTAKSKQVVLNPAALCLLFHSNIVPATESEKLSRDILLCAPTIIYLTMSCLDNIKI